jgi:hypothetical protein
MDDWVILGSDPMGKLQKMSPEIAKLLSNKLRNKESELINSLDSKKVSSAPIIGSHINNNNRNALIVNSVKGSIQGLVTADIQENKNEFQAQPILFKPVDIKIPKGNLVSVELKNGLGNRIFQILAAMRYAEIHNKQFVISKSLCIEGNKPHERGLSLILERLFPKVEIINSMPAYTVIKERILFNYIPLDYSETNVVLSGYFQDHRYLPEKFDIQVKRPEYLENTCFVHIRAGDYLLYTNEWGFDLNYYYKQCFEIIGKGVNFLVFSNDNEYADNYMKKFNVKYSISNTTNPLDVLLEMGSCAGGICANSTLSWIGAYIQNEKRGRVFMPSIWNNLRDCRGIYPNWARIISVKIDCPIVKIVEDTLCVPYNTQIPSFPSMPENTYTSSYGLMDIVIPVGPNDIDIINTQVIYTKANIMYYRNIYLIHANTDLKINGCTTVSENMFPFNMNTIEQLYGKTQRNGWYLQQLLKFYAGFIIPGILDRYLVLDSDTFFLKPTEFVKNGKCLYAYGKEFHTPYFDHMKRLHPSFKRVDTNKSGVCHHMMFDRSIIKEIMNLVESYHKCKFYEIFLKSVTDILHSGASEYELYFNYVLENYPDGITLRTLEWENVDKLTKKTKNDFESLHWYIRDKTPLVVSSMVTLPELPKQVFSFNNTNDLYNIHDVIIINVPIYNRKNYNACIVNDRIFFRSVDRPGEDNIMTCEFNDLRCNMVSLKTLSLISSFPNNKHVEDPRAIFHKGNWFVCYTDGYKVGIAKLDLQCNTIYTHYLSKPAELKFEGGDGREKNWIPLSMGDSIQIWYSDNPRTIMVYEDTGSSLEYKRFIKTNQYVKCRFGNIRGGCPPIDYDEHTKIWFFHTLFNRKYRIGAYLTRGLEVVSITPCPILSGEHIVFPCGAIKKGDDFYISMGVQDRNIGILKISNPISFVAI